MGSIESLVWIPDPLNIRDCQVIIFLNENTFIYANKDNDIITVDLKEHSLPKKAGIIKINNPVATQASYQRESYIYKIERKQNELVCYLDGSLRELKTIIKCELVFEDIMIDKI